MRFNIMKVASLNHLIILLALSSLSACKTNEINTRPDTTTVSANSDIVIKLPVRYSVEEFKTVNLVTQFSGDKETQKLIDLIETEVMSIKKFSQYARHFGSRAAEIDEMKREMSGNMGEARIMKIPDYILAVKVNKNKTSQKLSEQKELLLFTVELKYQINREKDNKNIKSGVIKGKAKRYKLYKARWNERLRRNFYDQVKGHGFNGTATKDDEDAFRQASRRAAKTLMNRMGNAFPAGGIVTNWRASGDFHQIVIDSGLNQGVKNNQVMVIYVNDGGIDTPIAAVKVESLAEDKSTLSLIKWKQDPFAKKIIEKLKNSNYQTPRKTNFYAVSLALPE